MKVTPRRRLALPLALGALGGGFIWLPACVLSTVMPASFSCASWHGTVWHGQCEGVSLDNSRSGDLTWQIKTPIVNPLAARIDWHWRRDASYATGALRVMASGDTSVQVHEASLSLQTLRDAMPARIALGPLTGISGTLATNELTIVWAPNGLRSASGPLHLREARLLRDDAPLGDFTAVFEGRAGVLRDLGGPLRLNGRIELTSPRAFRAKVRLEPRSKALTSLILGGQPTEAEIEGQF